MKQTKIPIINDKFDLAIFMQILKRNYWISLVLMILAILSAFVYLRYTQPTYNSSSILQINETNRTTRVLNIEDVYQNQNDDISKVIELLRSKEFLKRAFSSLNLEVSYFVEGTFLATELYNRSPFEIEWKANSVEMFDRPLYIEFNNIETARISTINGDQEFETFIKVNEWQDLYGGSLRCKIVDYNAIVEQRDNYKGNRYYFAINNPQNVVSKHIENLQISLLNRSAQTVEILYSGFNAEKSANIVNSIAEKYLTYDVEVKKESAENILAFIEERLKVVYQNLNETEKQLHAFKKENKINTDQYHNAGSPFPLFTSKINEFEDELINIEFELVALDRINKQIANEDNLNVYELIASLAGTKSETVVVNILNNLQQLINHKEQLLNDLTPDNLKIGILEKQIKNQKIILQDFIGTTLNRLKSKKNDYKIKISEYEAKLFDDKDFNELEYSKLERLYSINEGFYHKLIEKKAEYLISQAGYVSQNTILEKAMVPRSPIAPIMKKIYPLFGLFGLFLGAGFILLRYLFYDEIPSLNVIKNYTDAPILGTIPIYRKEIPVSQLLVNKNPNSIFTESFRTIRSNLQYISHGAETKIISVSSTVSGEGKSFVSINLAGILAISGKKVILLDLDLRKPRIHLGFNVENDKGVSTLLIGKHTLEECIQKSDLEGFNYITAGPIPPNPSELAAGKQMEDLLSSLEEIYDIIIVDTPPVGIVTDALSNLQRANYPIYVMRANVSKRHFIDNINDLIENKKISNLSVILNGVELHGRRYGSYGYGYGYGYGHGYYSDEEEDTSIGKKLTKKLQKLKK
ncbi:MAG: polysaccharide biosynthesis tyrosine autokinase [Salinivirgaceae bacterium]|jgi:tyrosine-protein kinase Etk/Wzc|nr:polysaccharide biosynthesis tyrosine autokinase [Salinivirgaceae bacterium]